jgi:hypothetical protein
MLQTSLVGEVPWMLTRMKSMGIPAPVLDRLCTGCRRMLALAADTRW